MKIGIDSYCYHRYFGEVYPGQSAPETPYTMDTFLDRAKELGCDGVSLESCFFPEFGEEYLAQLKAKLDDYGFDRVYAWGHPDGLEAGGNVAAKEEMISHVAHAKALGAPVMRVVGSSLMFRNEPHEPQLKILAQWFKEAVTVAEKENIKLAVENHIDYNSDEIKWLIDEIGSNFFGINFDTANFLRVLDDPVEAAAKLAPHVYATHVKDLLPVKGRSVKEWCYFASVAAGDGLIQIKEVAEVLRESNYDGFLAFETDMPHPDWENNEEGMVEKSIQYLKQTCGAI
jgi:sugar phosphate isomerase/epimerase